MTNVESMDYTHSHPSTIASLFSTVQLSPVPYTHHIPSSKQPHTYLLWHFHSHSEIYGFFGSQDLQNKGIGKMEDLTAMT